MKITVEQNWGDMDIRSKFAIISAVVAGLAGWVLTFLGFYAPPVGEISDGLLWVLGQALLYSAGVFGVSQYFTNNIKKAKKDISDLLNEKIYQMDERYVLKEENNEN